MIKYSAFCNLISSKKNILVESRSSSYTIIKDNFSFSFIVTGKV